MMQKPCKNNFAFIFYPKYKNNFRCSKRNFRQEPGYPEGSKRSAEKGKGLCTGSFKRDH